jgi:hypothetical protein
LIPYLSIDVEGLEFQGLKSLDLTGYKPEFILIEMLGFSLNELLTSDVSEFLSGYGYEVYGKAINTVFYKR